MFCAVRMGSMVSVLCFAGLQCLVGSMVSVCALRPCSGRSCEKHGLCLCFAALQLALQWKILMEDLARELNVRPDAVRLGHVRSRLTVRVLCNEGKNG